VSGVHLQGEASWKASQSTLRATSHVEPSLALPVLHLVPQLPDVQEPDIKHIACPPNPPPEDGEAIVEREVAFYRTCTRVGAMISPSVHSNWLGSMIVKAVEVSAIEELDAAFVLHPCML